MLNQLQKLVRKTKTNKTLIALDKGLEVLFWIVYAAYAIDYFT